MYFDSLKTKEEVKSRYKILAKKLHPDVGGDKLIMQEINSHYEKALNSFDKPEKPKKLINSTREKINAILRWSEDNPIFDPSFVFSLEKKLDSGQDLSYGQENSINNIIRKFKIKVKGEF